MNARRSRPPLALAAALLALALPARAAQFTVTVSDFTFTPRDLTIHAGDSVMWTNSGGFHNVAADDGSFRCAAGCQGEGGDGSPSSAAWSFTRTFDQAGTMDYHCEVHGSPGGVGMSGRIIVQPAASGQSGSLRFSGTTYAAGEGAGSAVITVQRVGGDDGAATVQYATANGTATAGSDYTARSGTLSWADGDDNPKTFNVPIADDGADESNETVLLSLASATGASLGSPAAATLTINDNDPGSPGPGGAPAAPANLHAVAQSTSEILLTWTDASSDETEFRIERRTLSGSFQQVDMAPAGSTSRLIGGLDPATAYVFRVRAANAAGVSMPSNEVQEATLAPAGPCVDGPSTLCLAGGRFRVEVAWRTAQDGGAGNAVPLPSAPDSGLFYFFSPTNIEMLVKVLNACGPPFDRFWVFFAATTNVELTLTVTDTQNGRTRVYFNPLNRSAPPVQDTDAFATCP